MGKRRSTKKSGGKKVAGADLEDRDEYTADNVFWVPNGARWPAIQKQARNAEIGKIVDKSMAAIEKENETLRRVLPQDYGKPQLDKRRLGELIDIVSQIDLAAEVHRAPARLHAGPKGHGPDLRPVLWVGRHVRPERVVHRYAWRASSERGMDGRTQTTTPMSPASAHRSGQKRLRSTSSC